MKNTTHVVVNTLFHACFVLSHKAKESMVIKMKKILCSLFVCFTVALILCVSVSAVTDDDVAEKNCLYLKKLTQIDDTVTFQLCLRDVTDVGVCSFGIIAEYDHSKLEYMDCSFEDYGGISVADPKEDGSLLILWVIVDELPVGDSEIAILTFKCLDPDISDKSIGIEPDGINPVKNYNSEIIENFEFIDGFVKPIDCYNVTGDVDGDGRVSLLDTAALMKRIAGWETEINEKETNIINDGIINLKDVAHLMKYLAKWDTVRLGHNDTVGVLREATCTEEGAMEFKCGVCGNIEETSIPMIPHDYVPNVNAEPTCIAEGVMEYTCSRCPDSYTMPIPATDFHYYSDGACIVCGDEDTDYEAKLLLFEYCETITKTGAPTDDGGYLLGYEEGNSVYCNFWYPEEEVFAMYASAVDEYDELFITVMILMDPNDFVSPCGIVYMYDSPGENENLITAIGTVVPEELYDMTSFEFTIYESVFGDDFRDIHEEIACELAKAAVMATSGFMSGITVEDLGFIGF